MLPIGFGWSLWIHLFVQHPKTVGAVLLAFVLGSVPVERTGFGTSQQSVARTLLCTVTAHRPAELCSPGSAAHVRDRTVPQRDHCGAVYGDDRHDAIRHTPTPGGISSVSVRWGTTSERQPVPLAILTRVYLTNSGALTCQLARPDPGFARRAVRA